jgi:magnesium-transporting ATPase (P-type)
MRQLSAEKDGLSLEEAARRLAKVGPNRLPAPVREGPLKRFFKHFQDILIYILIAAAGITALLGHWIDTGVIFGVFALVCVVSLVIVLMIRPKVET